VLTKASTRSFFFGGTLLFTLVFRGLTIHTHTTLAERTNSSPGVCGVVTSAPASSNRRISTPGPGCPQEPRLLRWNSGRSTVLTPSSVEP